MNTLLVPIDFTETSDNSLDYAVSLANYFEAKLILLHVDAASVYNLDATILTNTIEDIIAKSLKELEKIAVKIKKENSKITQIDCYAEGGDSKRIILDYITHYKVDYVVMGISGPETNIKKEIYGTLSLPISKKSFSPVFIIPENYKYKKIQKIAYACEYSSSIEVHNGLFQIKFITKTFNALLNVLHVVPENHILDKVELQADQFVETFLETTNHKTFVLTGNNPSQALLNFIRSNDIDLIVLEPKKHSFFHKLLYPSTTKEIAFNSPIPILTIYS
jgi:nucleotide-binding universal stress UspA family protein